MRRPRSSHVRWRELAAAALDGPLPADEQAALADHLARCVLCRAAARDYAEQRRRLRALAPLAPPRDLWARTSAALDREVARESPAARRAAERRSALLGGAVVASVTLVGLALMVVTTQSLPIERPRVPTATDAADVLRPTPFSVPSQALAFIGTGIDGLSVYRTRVERVCPEAFIDCVDYERAAAEVVSLPSDLQPSSVTLSPNGAQMAVQGRERDGEDVIAVVVFNIDRAGTPGDSSATAAPSAPTDTPSPTPTTDRTSALGSPSPASEPPAPTLTPTPVMASIAALPTEIVTDPPAPSPAPATPEPEADPSATPDPTPTAVGAPSVVAILEDVIRVGAPPAWSPDGSALAFSAMPADGSQGPDVYIWRPGDGQAQLLTDDHGSYFASWSGRRVVASRLVPPTAAEADEAAAGEPAIRNVFIDPVSGETRVASGLALWLPSVSPSRHHAVGWLGELRIKDNVAEPVAGALYLAGWSAADPFAGEATSPPEAPDDQAGGHAPGGSPEPSTSPVASEADGSLPTPGTASDASSDGEAAGTEGPQPPESAPPGAALTPVEPARDAAERTVQDWHVRWSPDGNVLGYWIADVPGSSWGELAVVALDPETGALARDEPLLGPSLARRSFTLGWSRVAWVAPVDDEPEGELRIRTWGPDGFGGLRVRPQRPGEVIPAS